MPEPKFVYERLEDRPINVQFLQVCHQRQISHVVRLLNTVPADKRLEMITFPYFASKRSPIMLTAVHNFPDVATAILQRLPLKSDKFKVINQRDMIGGNALQLAVINKNFDIFNILLRGIPSDKLVVILSLRPAPITTDSWEYSALIALAELAEKEPKYISTLEELLNHLKEPDKMTLLSQVDVYGNTALLHMVAHKQSAAAQLVLAQLRPANRFKLLSLSSRLDRNALMDALIYNDIAMVEVIINALTAQYKFAYLKIQHFTNETALMLAAESKKFAKVFIRLLLEGLSLHQRQILFEQQALWDDSVLSVAIERLDKYNDFSVLELLEDYGDTRVLKLKDKGWFKKPDTDLERVQALLDSVILEPDEPMHNSQLMGSLVLNDYFRQQEQKNSICSMCHSRASLDSSGQHPLETPAPSPPGRRLS